jgi:hypothetical protein
MTRYCPHPLAAAIVATLLAVPTLAADTDGDGIPDDQEVAATRDINYKDNDVYLDATLFVKQQYRDFFSREGDSTGITSWVNTISPGNSSRATVSSAFLTSAEYLGTVAPIVRLYSAAFVRIPDYGGLSYWITEYQKAPNSTTFTSIASFFASSTEFTTTYGALSNQAFVTLLYQNVLNRSPDSGGLAYWTGLLDSGTSRGSVLTGFSESAEYQIKTATAAQVVGAYAAMLRRAPTTDEYNSAIASLNAGTTLASVLENTVIGSTEYRLRFLPALNTGELTLDNCTTSIASDAPEFFKRYFRCVTITMSGSDVVITSNVRPPHRSAYYSTTNANYAPFDTGRGTVYRKNPNSVSTTATQTLTITGSPVSRGLTITTSLVDQSAGTSSFEYTKAPGGISPNGVGQFHGVAAPGDSITNELYTFDGIGGHPQNTGIYHYHGIARGALEAMAKNGYSSNTAPGGGDAELYGIMCDGTVILGCKGLDGVAPDPSTLDAQNGKVGDIKGKDGTVYFTNRYHVYACASFTGGKARVLSPEIQYYSSCR